MFGCVRIHSDAFGYIRMRSDAFGCVRMRSEVSETFWEFSGENLYSVDDSERFRRFLEVFGCVRMHSDAFGCIRKFLEASGNFRFFCFFFLRISEFFRRVRIKIIAKYYLSKVLDSSVRSVAFG